MTDHELVLEHIASNHRLVEEVIRSLVRLLPGLDEDMTWIVNEHLRVNKEIQAEYHATKQDRPRNRNRDESEDGLSAEITTIKELLSSAKQSNDTVGEIQFEHKLRELEKNEKDDI